MDSVDQDDADMDVVVTREVVLRVLALEFGRVPFRLVQVDKLYPLVFLCQPAS